MKSGGTLEICEIIVRNFERFLASSESLRQRALPESDSEPENHFEDYFLSYEINNESETSEIEFGDNEFCPHEESVHRVQVILMNTNSMIHLIHLKKNQMKNFILK